MNPNIKALYLQILYLGRRFDRKGIEHPRGDVYIYRLMPDGCTYYPGSWIRGSFKHSFCEFLERYVI